VSDNFNKEYIQTYVSNKLSLEETTNTYLALMKISKVSKKLLENSRDVVDIKKENLSRDFDPSMDECNYLELTQNDKPFNITLETFEIECSEAEVSKAGEVIALVSAQRVALPIVFRLNPGAYKNESDFKKNNQRKFKNAKLTYSELLSKCYDYFEIPYLRDFIIRDFRLPTKNDSIKSYCISLNNALMSKQPNWKLMMSNS